MKKSTIRITLAIFCAVFGSVLLLWPAQAQIDAFTYFIPYRADELSQQFNVTKPAAGGYPDIRVIISISIDRDNTIIFYDHWEDGLETNLTSPTQPTTQIWGDNDPANGIPPGFTTDQLNGGDVIALDNVVPVAAVGNPNNLFFDGGDKLTTSGRSVAVTLAAWPEPVPGSLFAGAWELYPTSRWSDEYVIPIGENLAPQRGGFTEVSVNVQAVTDNTTVELDLDDDGTFETTITLNEGEQLSQAGAVTRSGAQVRASSRVQVHVFTSDPDRRWEARAYTMLPLDQWTNDYLAARSSDGDFWLYNPDPNTPLDITVETESGATTLSIPAGGNDRYPTGGMGASTTTGVRFTSTDGRPFYGLAALDAGERRDWGYPLLPIDKLTTQVLVGWAPGNINMPPNGSESRIYVTAVTTTTLFADFNGDGTADASFLITPLAETPVTDFDDDLTGAFLFTTNETPFVAVWGQDQSSPPAAPSLDLGVNIAPLFPLQLQTKLALSEDRDGTGKMNRGDVVRFDITVLNNSPQDISPVSILDILPAALGYVTGTTTVDGNFVPDAGVTPFPLDEGGLSLSGGIPRRSIVTVAFNAVIKGNVNSISSQVSIISLVKPEPDMATISVPVFTAGYDLQFLPLILKNENQ